MGLFQNWNGDSFNTKTLNYPEQLAGFWSLIIAIISVLGTLFLTNDGFYYGEFHSLKLTSIRDFIDANGISFINGVTFHLLSPLVKCSSTYYYV